MPTTPDTWDDLLNGDIHRIPLLRTSRPSFHDFRTIAIREARARGHRSAIVRVADRDHIWVVAHG